MSRGRHAADDGSFNRSAGMAAGRGAALLAVAVLIGILLLSATDDGPRVSAGPGDTRAAVSSSTAAVEPSTTSTTVVAARPPAEVKVLTLNATDVRGAAGAANSVAKDAGFNVLAPSDAPRGTATAVYFTTTFEAEAGAVAAALGLSPTVVQPLPMPPPAPDLKSADVVVIVGADLAARVVSSTTTTAAGAARSTTSTSSGGATTSTTAAG